MKPVWKSLTLWSAVVALVGAVLAFFASGQSAVGVVSDPGVQAAIGEVLTVLGFVGTVAGRLRVGDLTAKGPPDERGAVTAGLVMGVVVAFVGALLWGCAATDIRAETEVHPYFDPGPPCLITVDVDGHRVHRTRWDQPCPIDMPTAWLCARLAEKAPGAKLPAVCAP
jgi:hypothetical protein